MENSGAFGKSVAKIFLKITAVLLGFLAVALFLLPFFAFRFVIESLLGDGFGGPISMIFLMGWSFFLWWLNRFAPVERAMNALEDLLQTCWHSDPGDW